MWLLARLAKQAHRPAATAAAALLTIGALVALAGPSATAANVDSCGYGGTSDKISASRPDRSFKENAVLRGASVSLGASGPKTINVFYGDGHALLLGASRDSGTTPVTELTKSPDHAANPHVGDNSATDGLERPFFPALFITDITTNPANKAGDWQNFGVPLLPSDVFGTWKSAVLRHRATGEPIEVQEAKDPSPPNNWNLGPGADPLPEALPDTKFGAEVRWDLGNLVGVNGNRVILTPGRTYRAQFIVHGGDQNKAGTNAGERCTTFTIPGANIQITPQSAVNDVQQETSHTLTARVNVVNAGFPNGTSAPAGTPISFHIVSGPGAVGVTGEPIDVQTLTCNTIGNTGSCSVTLTNTTKTPGLTVVQACATVLNNPCTGDGQLNDSPNAQKQWVDADLLLTPRSSFSVAGQPHTITATVRLEDGLPAETTGGDNCAGHCARAGATVNFSFSQNPASAVFVGGVSSCTTNTSGQCSVSINSLSGGTVQVHATTTFDITGVSGLSQSVTRSTGAFNPTDSHTDTQDTYFRPSTTLTVRDRLVGLPPQAQGTVRYQVFTNSTCSAATAVGEPIDVQAVDGVVPTGEPIDVQVAGPLGQATTLYFQATFTAAPGSPVPSFTLPCTNEMASTR